MPQQKETVNRAQLNTMQTSSLRTFWRVLQLDVRDHIVTVYRHSKIKDGRGTLNVISVVSQARFL